MSVSLSVFFKRRAELADWSFRGHENMGNRTYGEVIEVFKHRMTESPVIKGYDLYIYRVDTDNLHQIEFLGRELLEYQPKRILNP